VRDFLFEESTGYYQVDKPSDWAWGSGELDAPFVIVRTADPAFLDGVDQLRSRKLKLADKRVWLKQNIWTGGVLGPTEEREQIVPPAFIVVKTGKSYSTVEDAWDSGLDNGDLLFYTQNPQDERLPGWLQRVINREERVLSHSHFCTLAEVGSWPS
jgi:hypothetical protein